MNEINNEEVYRRLALIHKDKSPKQIKFIIDRMWADVRRTMREPSKSKKGILITGFGKFYINPNVVREYIDSKIERGIDITGEKDQELINTLKILDNG